MIRPELALYSVVFLAIAFLHACSLGGYRTIWAAGVTIFGAAAIPAAYQVFRMGYYAAVIPNTAIAKEAFSGHWAQGECYFNNFFRTYGLVFPLVALGGVSLQRLWSLANSREWLAFGTAFLLPFAAVLHTLFIVAMGGDYMHGRMFIPALFAALLPVSIVPLPAHILHPRGLAVLAAAAVIAIWVPICASTLRVRSENVCNIGDERGWYSRRSGVANPIVLSDFHDHPFFGFAKDAKASVAKACPDLPWGGPGTSTGGCRALILRSEERDLVVRSPESVALAPEVDSRVAAVISAGAIGIEGYYLPATVEVADVFGLSEPFVARFELLKRGRPGHEKKLSSAWELARYAAPTREDDAGVSAARHALHCGELALLDKAVHEPLTLGRFLSNFSHSWALSRLRIPSDPFEAETRFCGTKPMAAFATSGGGGDPFRWRCPEGRPFRGLRGGFEEKGGRLTRIQAVCAGADEDVTDQAARVIGPRFGEGNDVGFDVACPQGSVAIGMHGRSDGIVHSIGLNCRGVDSVVRTSEGGNELGPEFEFSCPSGPGLGIVGRSGSLVDAIGILCNP